MFKVPEQYRKLSGRMASDSSNGNNGCFIIPALFRKRESSVIASDGMGWEHVSVHAYDGHQTLTPFWDEMSYIKGLFWGEEDVVIEYHPAKSHYVNNHTNVLHLWRPTDAEIPTPPDVLVGVKT